MRGNDRPFKLQCGENDSAQCLKALSSEKPLLESAGGCEPRAPEGRTCSVSVGGYNLNILVGSDAPGQILRVDVVSEDLIIADYRAD